MQETRYPPTLLNMADMSGEYTPSRSHRVPNFMALSDNMSQPPSMTKHRPLKDLDIPSCEREELWRWSHTGRSLYRQDVESVTRARHETPAPSVSGDQSKRQGKRKTWFRDCCKGKGRTGRWANARILTHQKGWLCCH